MTTKPETSPLAIASLVLSCLGALTFGLLAVPGIICGCLAKGEIRRGHATGRPLAQAGIIVGAAILILWIGLPALLLGGFGFLELAEARPGIALGVVGILILLTALPFVFTSLAKRRDSRNLRRVVMENRTRS